MATPQTPQIIDLTQGHLEEYQAVLREKMQAVNALWAHHVGLLSPLVPTALSLAPPATHAFPFYLKFITLVRERTEQGKFNLSLTERRGLIVRAAITSGWLVEAPWTVEEVPTLPAKLVAWLGKHLDETYSDFDYDVDKAQAEAALEAGWFLDLSALPVQPSEVERLAQTVKQAYRLATELDPE